MGNGFSSSASPVKTRRRLETLRNLGAVASRKVILGKSSIQVLIRVPITSARAHTCRKPLSVLHDFKLSIVMSAECLADITSIDLP